MGLATCIAIYFVIWWTVLFAILPLGIRTQADEDEVMPGTEPGAPVRPRHLLKFALTSIVSAVLLLGIYVVVQTDMFGIMPAG